MAAALDKVLYSLIVLGGLPRTTSDRDDLTPGKQDVAGDRGANIRFGPHSPTPSRRLNAQDTQTTYVHSETVVNRGSTLDSQSEIGDRD